jgi:hypothetical protein
MESGSSEILVMNKTSKYFQWSCVVFPHKPENGALMGAVQLTFSVMMGVALRGEEPPSGEFQASRSFAQARYHVRRLTMAAQGILMPFLGAAGRLLAAIG